MARQKRSSWAITQAVIFALMLRELLTRFGSRRMGAFWVLFEPILHITVMMLIFTYIRQRSVPGMDFPVFLLTGIVPFFFMRSTALRLMDAVEANRSLFAYPNIQILDTYVARILVEMLIYATVYALLIFALGFWFGYDVSIEYPLAWIAALCIGILFSFGLGVIFSIIVQVAPNAKFFIRMMFMPLYFLSGVVIPLWNRNIPAEFIPWLLWNPYLHIIENIRSSIFVYYPKLPGINYTYPASLALVFLFMGLGLYRIRKEALLTR